MWTATDAIGSSPSGNVVGDVIDVAVVDMLGNVWEYAAPCGND